ncbi:hypothetical protein OROMI_001021 [Orobanche minor]
MAPRKSTGKEKIGSSSQEPTPPHKMQNLGCIKERLFKLEDFVGNPDIGSGTVNFIQNFLDNGWEKFINNLPNGNPVLTLNFYNNFNKAIGQEGSSTYHVTTVNGKNILFSSEIINNYLGVDNTNATDISTLPDDEIPDEGVLRWALRSELHDSIGMIKPRYNQSDLVTEAWFLWMWAAGSIYPTSTLTTVSIGHLRGIYAISRGVKMDLGTHIYNNICHYAGTVPTRKKMPFPCIITGICRAQKVKIPTGSNILTHGDRLNKRSGNLRDCQLKGKRPRVEAEMEDRDSDREDEEDEDLGSYDRDVLERIREIETSQAELVRGQNEIIERQIKTEKCFEKLFRFLNIPDDAPGGSHG